MIVSILMERNLRVVANYLVLSLAVADLLVAVLVMPLGAVNEVSRQNLLLPYYLLRHVIENQFHRRFNGGLICYQGPHF